MRRIAFVDMQQMFEQILQGHGFTLERAAVCARLFAENSLDGVYSHGVNRFAGFVDFVRPGYIDVNAEPILQRSLGAWEQWHSQMRLRFSNCCRLRAPWSGLVHRRTYTQQCHIAVESARRSTSGPRMRSVTPPAKMGDQ